MAINRTPVLKRCRALGLDPVYLGVNKKSKRQPRNARRKISEYGLQLRENRRLSIFTECLRNLSVTTIKKRHK